MRASKTPGTCGMSRNAVDVAAADVAVVDNADVQQMISMAKRPWLVMPCRPTPGGAGFMGVAAESCASNTCCLQHKIHITEFLHSF
jgi:hypothetical protein